MRFAEVNKYFMSSAEALRLSHMGYLNSTQMIKPKWTGIRYRKIHILVNRVFRSARSQSPPRFANAQSIHHQCVQATREAS